MATATTECADCYIATHGHVYETKTTERIHLCPLHAAAPALLAVLQALYAVTLNGQWSPGAHEARIIARAAIEAAGA